LQTHNVSSSEDWRLKQSVSRSLRFFNAHVTEIETTFYERPSSVLYSLSEAAAKEFMSTELRVRGLIPRSMVDVQAFIWSSIQIEDGKYGKG